MELYGLYWQICDAKSNAGELGLHQHLLGVHNKGIQNNFFLDGHCCVEFWEDLTFCLLSFMGLRLLSPEAISTAQQANKAGVTLLQSKE